MYLQSGIADTGQCQFCFNGITSSHKIPWQTEHSKILGMLAECLLDTWIKGPGQKLIISHIIPILLVCTNFIENGIFKAKIFLPHRKHCFSITKKKLLNPPYGNNCLLKKYKNHKYTMWVKCKDSEC
jgi:hypothetical protein